MHKRILLLVSGVGVIVVLGLVLFGRQDGADNSISTPIEQGFGIFESVVSNEGDVKVSVVPMNLGALASEWSFQVFMETHSVELSEDMLKISKLVLGSGEVSAPSRWEGDSPGGHHRSGTLTFDVPAKPPSSVILKILGVGGVPEREFRWKIK